MSYKFYQYKKCSTCKKAQKYLDSKKVIYKEISIRETPPSKAELKKMFKFMGGELKKLFNTSGMDYRSMNMKEKLPTLKTEEALDLLSKNGNLIKRPFLIGKNFGVVGFKEDIYKENL